jgi:hypothetical protein
MSLERRLGNLQERGWAKHPPFVRPQFSQVSAGSLLGP